MRVPFRSWPAAVAIILVAGLTLSACGDKNGTAGTVDTGVGSTAEGALTQANFAEQITAAQLKARTSHLEVTAGGSNQEFTASGDVALGSSAADTAMAMTMDLGSRGIGGVEIRLVDQVAYLNFGPITGNKFAKLVLTDTDNPIGAQYAKILEQLDPSQLVEQFDEAITSFATSGEAVAIDGVEAQPYAVTLDTAKLASDSGLTGGGAIPPTIDFTMFVGPDNLPRRLTSDAGAQGAAVSIDYSKWGEDVDIKVPPADEISDKDLLSEFGGLPNA